MKRKERIKIFIGALLLLIGSIPLLGVTEFTLPQAISCVPRFQEGQFQRYDCEDLRSRILGAGEAIDFNRELSVLDESLQREKSDVVAALILPQNLSPKKSPELSAPMVISPQEK